MATERMKVLTVTRDPVLLGFLQKELNSDMFEVVNTKHTDDNLKDLLDLENPEFIIIDIMMPTLDGVGTCLQIRQWTQSPIMMLSTWDTGDNTVRGLNLGSDNYLTEPFGSDELKKRIVETIEK